MLSRPALWVIWAGVAALTVFLILARLTSPMQSARDLDYKTFITCLEGDKIQTFDAVGLDAHGTLTDGTAYSTEIPNRDTLLAQQIVKHVKGTVRFESATPNSPMNVLLVFLPFIFVAVAVGVILRAVRRGPPDQR